MAAVSSIEPLKTPLRYPGGKSRACKKIQPYLPNLYEFDSFYEPFLGGGSLAIYITKKYRHLRINVGDLYEPLYNFWICLQGKGEEMAKELKSLKSSHSTPDLAKELFTQSKDIINDDTKSELERAIAFYIVNKCSFSGLTESSSFSESASNNNFSLRGIQHLHAYQQLIQRWRIVNFNYSRLMGEVYWTANRRPFIYLDPPYDINDNLYGKKGEMHKKFDHDDFATYCENFRAKLLISYNSDQLVKKRFKDWNVAEFDLTYTMRSVGEYMREQKSRKELLIFNYNIEEQINGRGTTTNGLIRRYEEIK